MPDQRYDAYLNNILNQFSSYTYNFKLYAIDKDSFNEISSNSVDYEDIHKSEYIARAKKAIIVESGVTNLKIDDVSITSRPSTTDATFITNIGFKITQPKGFSFIESMVAAGSLCGWDGFYSSPFMIFEISFKGWYGDNGSGKTAQIISIPIQISKVNTEIDGGGSRYSIEAAVMFNSNRQVYNSTIGSMTINGCTDFNSFLSKFESKLNTETTKDKSNGNVVSTTHKFKAHGEIGRVMLNSPSDPNHPLHNNSASREEGASGASYSISNQLSIPKILESVLVTSKEMQDKILVKDNEIFGVSFQIDPVVRILEYNPVAGEYQYEITWNIRELSTMIIRNRGKASVSALKDLTGSDSVRFNKVYTHYFTGSNTEVLSANLETSNLYFNKLTRYESLFLNESNDKSMKQGDTSRTPERVKSVAQVAQEQERTKQQITEQSGQQFAIESGDEVYVDDIDVSSIEKLAQYRYMYRFARDNQGSVPVSSGGDPAESKSQDVYDALRNTRNKLYVSALRMDLEIRGDPYWLCPMNGNYEAKSINRLSNLKANTIGFITGFPNEVQENGVRNDYMFSGIYIVTNVTSSFNAGKFTQKLECTRINEVNGGTFINHFGRDEE